MQTRMKIFSFDKKFALARFRCELVKVQIGINDELINIVIKQDGPSHSSGLADQIFFACVLAA